MTIEQAKFILATYKLPMSPLQLAQFKIALAMAGGYWGRRS